MMLVPWGSSAPPRPGDLRSESRMPGIPSIVSSWAFPAVPAAGASPSTCPLSPSHLLRGCLHRRISRRLILLCGTSVDSRIPDSVGSGNYPRRSSRCHEIRHRYRSPTPIQVRRCCLSPTPTAFANRVNLDKISA
jgi:hypothetical protein